MEANEYKHPLHNPKAGAGIRTSISGKVLLKRRYLIFLLVFALTAAAVGPSPAVAAKETLVLAIHGEPATGFDPVLGWGRYGHPLFQNTLLVLDDDLNITRDLAVDYRVSQDALTWRVQIRTDARFSDGLPLTAEDVAFTFNAAKTAGGKVDLTRLKEARALSAHTVEFQMRKPDSTFINRLVTLGIVPKHLYGPGYGRRPVGAGPYRLVSWSEGEQLIAEVNPYYYGEKPPFHRLVFLYGKEDTMFAAAKAGSVDMVVVPAYLGKQKISGMHLQPVKSVDNRGLMFPMVPDQGLKTKNGDPIGNDVTADPAIRHAVNLALDRKALVRGVLEGFGRPAYFACDGLPWDSPANRIPDADPHGAKAILECAGWIDRDGDGIREKNGQRAEFTIIYPSERSIRQGLALACVDMLAPIGIRARVVGKSIDEIQHLGHAHVVVYGWGSHDPMEIFHLYHSSMVGLGHYNAGYYANPTVDGYMEKALSVADFGDSLKFWQKAQWDGRIGAGPRGDAPWAWLVNLDHVYFVSDCLDIGRPRTEPHGHGWPITANLSRWKWTCSP